MDRCVIYETPTMPNGFSRRDSCLCGRLENYDRSWTLWILPRRLHDGTGEDSAITGLFKEPRRAFTWSRGGSDGRYVEGDDMDDLVEWFRVMATVMEVMSS